MNKNKQPESIPLSGEYHTYQIDLSKTHQPELFPATPVVVKAVRNILGMNTLEGEQRRAARQEARKMLKLWLYQIGQGPDPINYEDNQND